MRKIIFLITAVLVLSCNNSKKSDINNEKVVKKELQPFFDSDRIDHYYLNLSENNFFKLIKKENKTEKEKELINIYIHSFPDNIPQEDFEKTLLSHNYKKSNLSIKDEKSIENVFSEKDSLKNDACACIAEYKDVFIFKKNAKTVGIAKICFKNARFQIIGSKINTEGFGLINELDKLHNIVRPNEKKT
ncbi:hypothetical protein [Flavobacterium cutihirudinis]|uniref:hypothetical protein n=1 Tax=Flavobacterium cutihirudinis TaxID=1265740 RepID=UPI0011C06672|nr:hypothetical protein [Flavobacterium cutihirudinis]